MEKRCDDISEKPKLAIAVASGRSGVGHLPDRGEDAGLGGAAGRCSAEGGMKGDASPIDSCAPKGGLAAMSQSKKREETDATQVILSCVQSGPLTRPPSPSPLPLMGSSYGPHEGYCRGEECPQCYKYSCSACSARSNRFLAPCWNCGSIEC
jgi:hypothetical protein